MKDHLKSYVEESKTAHVRGLRILLEYFYATEIFEEINKNRIKIISVFGSARTKPQTAPYLAAYRLGDLLYRSGFAVVTGASRGIMQAANQGVADSIAREVVKKGQASSLEAARATAAYRRLLGRHSVGLSISLPMEIENNPYVGVSATFHYFMVRKFFFGTLSSGFVACEGGWGTRDELFEMLTLVQTGKSPLMPIVYLSPNPEHLRQDLQHALSKKYISKEDLHLLRLVKTPQQAHQEILRFYRVVDQVVYDRDQVVRVVMKKPLSASLRRAAERILAQDDLGATEIEWKAKELILRHYAPHSYGVLRRVVDLINGT